MARDLTYHIAQISATILMSLAVANQQAEQAQEASAAKDVEIAALKAELAALKPNA